MARIPINKAADSVVYFERMIEFQSPGEVELSRRFRESPYVGSFRPQRRTATIRSYRIRNLVLDGSTMVAYQDGLLIDETASLRSSLSVFDEQPHKLPTPTKVENDVVIGCNTNWTMYNHWLMQCLPTIDWSLTFVGDDPKLALPELACWQEETLRLLGYASVPRITIRRGETYQFRVGEYSDFLHANTPFLISGAALDTLQRLANAVDPFLDWSGSVYVFSLDEHYGKLENRYEIAEFFRKQGFTLIIPDQCEFAEQVEIFRSARIVVGPHSSSMANIAFCKPGALVWEFFPEHYANACNQRIAQAAGLDYWADLFDGASIIGGRDWRIDLAVVSERFRDIDPPRRRPRFWLADGNRGSFDSADVERTDRLPLDELLLEFESLGEDCEFGLVQRDVGIEPLGLLRFSSFRVPWEQKLAALIEAIDKGFEGLGALDTIRMHLEDQPGQRKEYMLTESAYNLQYHTFVLEGDADAEQLRRQQSRVLAFLQQKLLVDLEVGEKIWIWKGRAQTRLEDTTELLHALQRRGPNVLLWVSYEDDAHPANTIERFGDDLVRGYIAKPASDLPTDFEASRWHAVCRAAFAILRPPDYLPQG